MIVPINIRKVKEKYRNKKWVSYFYRTAQPITLALFPTWGIHQELVVKDLPTGKDRDIIFGNQV